MIDTDYSLETYIQEITPIVEEAKRDKQILAKFSQSLNDLRQEMKKCDDNLSIFLSWEDDIGRELHASYTEEELLELHGHPNGKIYKTHTHHTIVDNNEHIIDFHWCSHRYYTPIRSVVTMHQCLRCD